MIERYLPVEVQRKDKKELWQLDISRLGLKELVELRNELHGVNETTIRVLEGFIYNNIEDKHLYKVNNKYVNKKEAKRTRKLERKLKNKTTYRKGRK